ncbi:MAG: Lrp/AsnC ligand binding domain-containing protein [Bacteroidia bacterium]
MQLDKLDRTILEALMKDARMPYLEISRMCGVSGATVHLRVQKLEKMGLIQGSRLMVDYKKLGLGVRAFLGLYLDQVDNYDDIFKRLEEVPEVVECHFTTGTYAMFVKVLCRDTNHLRDVLIEKIQNIPNVRRTETFISLQETVNKEPGLEVLFDPKDENK